MPVSCLLGRKAGRSPTTADEMDEMRRRAWLQQGVLAVRADDDRLTWDQRELVRQIGRKLYGGREHGEVQR